MKQINHTIVENLLINLNRFSKVLRINELKLSVIRFFAYFFIQSVVIGSLFYFLELAENVRYSLIWIVLLWNGYLLVRWFFVPLKQLMNSTGFTVMSADSTFIGRTLVSVDDKLKNSLELVYKDGRTALEEEDLIRRAEGLKDISFSAALPRIDWKKWFVVFFMCLGVLLTFVVAEHRIISVGLTRFVQPGVNYSNSDLRLVLDQKEFQIGKGDDLEVEFLLTGSSVPEEIFVKRNEVVEVVPVVDGIGRLLLRNIDSDLELEFFHGNLTSERVFVKVIERVEFILDSVYFDNPIMGGQLDNVVDYGNGQFRVFKGSVVRYHGSVVNGYFLDGSIHGIFIDSVSGAQEFIIQLLDFNGDTSEVVVGDYQILMDLPPQIEVMRSDSFVLVKCMDDFGLHSLAYKSEIDERVFAVSGTEFTRMFTLGTIRSWGEGRFMVCDNGKPQNCSVSGYIEFEKVDDLISEYLREKDAGVSRGGVSGADEMDIQAIANEIARKKDLVDAMNLALEAEEPNARVKQLQEFNNKLSLEEYNELLERIDSLEQSIDSDEFQEKLEELISDLDRLEEDLGFSLDLYKQWETNHKLETMIEDLNKSIEMQEDLLGKDLNVDDEVLSLNEELIKQSKDLDSLMSDELGLSKSMEEISKELSESGDKEKQNSAKEKSKELSERMSQKLMEMNSGAMEDLESLRRILEGLKLISSEQEVSFQLVMDDKDEVFMRQRLLEESFVVLDDSLRELAIRVPLIGDKIFTELKVIKHETEMFNSYYAEGDNGLCQVSLGKTLTAENELAVLLDDVIQNMEEQMGKEGDGECSKPGNNPKPGNGMSSEALQKMLSRMKSLEKGLSEGEGQKDVSKGNSGMGEDESKRIAELIMVNQAMRKSIRDVAEESEDVQVRELSKDMIRLLESQERNVLSNGNSVGNAEFMNQISRKMLELDNAVKEQEYSNERNSVEGIESDYDSGRNIDSYLQRKLKELEGLRISGLKYNYYYKQL